ncbi:hypothetical protein [Sinorhizobium meliloti]|uniref:hypothetical protein n=1 Tax=Rhizobium meliloti TaxID=382 RepID=UPI000FD948AB|nr:hypothetical protein [Sinorhizobium meliloti]RVO68368.1 hypothetical protein CN087_12905 [Sinorhizobium meliloti]
MAPCVPSPVTDQAPQASPELTQFAALSLAMQLHKLAGDHDLGGNNLAIDENGPLLTPNPVRGPGPLAVSATIPEGVTVGAVLALIGDALYHPELTKAFATMLSAKQALDVSQATAQQHIDAFIAAAVAA